MCGVAGIYAYGNAAPPVDRQELLRVREAMIHRGPDGAGLWLSADQRVGLAHRRLSIIDLSDHGAQPMASADNMLRITFNGEIYNYRELRRELERGGCRFQSQSDTEVLLHLYAERGMEMVHALRGMYAFAIWDERRHGLFIARDPFGIKPLYYADDGSTFRVASQVKALLKGGAISTEPAPAGYVGYYLWGHVPDPYTLYRDIRAVPAGHHLWVDRAGRPEPREFFNITGELRAACASGREAHAENTQDELRAALLDSVRHHLVADVPVGVFLSAGLDSTTLTALARETGVADLRTVTLGFKEYAGNIADEVPLAEAVARRYHTTHSTSWVNRSDFRDELRNVVDAMDQPSTDGINSYFVSKAAKAAGLKVVLSGVGGDELFGSYPSFRQIPLMNKIAGPFSGITALGRSVRRVTAPLLKYFTSPKYASLLEYGGTFGGGYMLRRGMYMPWELNGLMDPDMLRQGWEELQTFARLSQTMAGIDNTHLKITALESAWYMRSQLLRDTDWASMAHSLEIRVPFVDVALFRIVAKLLASDNPPTKKDMAMTPGVSLPPEVVARRKTGFVVPVREWLLEDYILNARERRLRGWAHQLLRLTGNRPARILALVTDAYGGIGGIAKFNRDLIGGLAGNTLVSKVVVLPRIAPMTPETIPEKAEFRLDAMGGKVHYIKTLLRVLFDSKGFDLIVCGHINLLPVAYMAKRLKALPLMLIGHGIDVWQPCASRTANRLVPKVDVFVAVSGVTRQRFVAWSGMPPAKCRILPNCFDPGSFTPGPKDAGLLRRYGLEHKTVLLTVGRLASRDRYKGFDVVLDSLPQLRSEIPNLAYLIAGDGDDRVRLQAKATRLGVGDLVVFAGYIPEDEKVQHYRLGDAYVMPSKGEGFGIVYLEAMACGLPTVGSRVDGGREALRDGALGILVDPDNAYEVRAAVHAALARPKTVPEGLSYFSSREFDRRLNGILEEVFWGPQERLAHAS